MSKTGTVGELVAAFLEACGTTETFGVISIHNMPILDAIAMRNRIRYVSSRGEAGAVNMADAASRVSGRLSVAFTSTGTAAGNAAGGMVEALTAGTAMLHITGQIELPYLDRNMGYIHEARDQMSLLKAVSKAAFRIWTPETALGVLREAVRIAQTPPCGPVSVEIPIDVQAMAVTIPDDLSPLPILVPPVPEKAVDELAKRLSGAKRPLLWLGGGARDAGAAVKRLVDLGFGIITTVQGRGVLSEDHPKNLGAYTTQKAVQALLKSSDAIIVVGSRLRSNETLKYALALPHPLYQIDIDSSQDSRAYKNDMFVCGEAQSVLDALADRLTGKIAVEPGFGAEITKAKHESEAELRDDMGPYVALMDALQQVVGRDFLWVRDVTVSNSMWGNRGLKIYQPKAGVHALGGGIGMGLQMGIGAALAGEGRKVACLVGDGGLQLGIGELACAFQEQADLLLVIMNSGGYQVIKNIQDAQYGGRHCYVDLHTPDYTLLCKSMAIPHVKLTTLDNAAKALQQALDTPGPAVVEIDMAAIGPFKRAFAGPPVKK
jgi:acetolactate synthase-1/2/3 large subunit